MSINSAVIRLHQEWHLLPLVPRTCGERCDFDTIAEFIIRRAETAVAEERQRIAELVTAALIPDDVDEWSDNNEGWNRALGRILRDLSADNYSSRER